MNMSGNDEKMINRVSSIRAWRHEGADARHEQRRYTGALPHASAYLDAAAGALEGSPFLHEGHGTEDQGASTLLEAARAGNATASADEEQAAPEAALAALEPGLCGELEASATATSAATEGTLVYVKGDCKGFELYLRGLPENLLGIPVLPRGEKGGRHEGGRMFTPSEV